LIGQVKSIVNEIASTKQVPTGTRIAETAAALFADKGYAGVSMREIAEVVGIKAASIYNHFDDKEALYLAAIEHAFAGRIALLEQATQSGGTAEERLVSMVVALTSGNAVDEVSAKIMQWELLSGDVARQKWLAERLFRRPFMQMSALLNEISPTGDGKLVAVYLTALTMGCSALMPIYEQLGVSGLVSDPDALGRDIAQRLLSLTNEANL
jgi:TetR/AcrR family transcriptional regulator